MNLVESSFAYLDNTGKSTVIIQVGSMNEMSSNLIAALYIPTSLKFFNKASINKSILEKSTENTYSPVKVGTRDSIFLMNAILILILKG